MDTSFGGFVKGKFLDSMIVWVLCYIAFSIFRIPFVLLISSFIAITNIIPVIGPLIGAIPTGIIILLTEPQKFIPFLIIVIIQFIRELIAINIADGFQHRDYKIVSGKCFFTVILSQCIRQSYQILQHTTLLQHSKQILSWVMRVKSLPTLQGQAFNDLGLIVILYY
jgi:hypothetical protein